MVTPRNVTATEWRDLARGQRILAMKDAEEYERRKDQSNAERYPEFQKLHAELCEHWANQVHLAE
jgi:hypothetical protein